MPELFDRLAAALGGRYRLERELGRGGMATVYLAQDLKHDRRVAIKVLRPELAAALGPERFLREIRLTAQLDHPHILALLDSGEADGFLYYVMPYVEGESLRDRLAREKQLPLEDALQIAREVADALSHAHSHSIVHRDIKPENVLMAGRHARVADFGIARAVTAAGGETLTETGLAIGTPAYMSPEQAGGEKDLDGRSDVYSLGCVLYEMLAGHPPFTGGTAHEILARHSMDAVPSLAAARPAVSLGIERAIATALAKTPADRYGTAAQFAQALVPTAAPLFVAPSPRRVRPFALIGVAVVVVVGTLLFMRRPAREAPAAAAPASERTAIAVLPFQNLSAEGPHAYFASGLHDELLTQLSKVAALKVISRTSVMGYAGPSMPPLRQIASELGVGSVVEGSLQVVGGRLRVNVQLIDAATDAHLWAERYDRTLDDAFAIQSDIAQQIVAAVGAALAPTEEQRLAAAPTANTEAYRLYLQGLEYLNRPGFMRQNYEAAQQLLEQALVMDRDFATAHAALSEVHGFIYWMGYDHSPARAARQRQEAQTALRLAPHLPHAHMAMGLAHYHSRAWSGALEEYSVALEGLPNDAELWQRIAWVHRRLGNWAECLPAVTKAMELSPRNADLFMDLGGITFVLLHRYAEAERAFDRALSLAPDFHESALYKGRTHVLWHGQLDTLRAALQRAPRDVRMVTLGTTAADYLQLLHWERQADSLLTTLSMTGLRVFDAQYVFLPNWLYAAWGHQLRGDRAAARAAFDSALVLLDSVITELPDDWRVHAARGLTLAGLGRQDQALREAGWLRRSVVYRQDAYFSPLVAEDRARILAQAGEAEAALDEIERLLAGASFLSVHTLRLDPRWDPIRDHPRFKALLARYESQAPN